MHIYTLLSILPFVLAVHCGVWDLISDLLTTGVTFIPEDAKLNIRELANKYGYNLVNHTVTTEDGYIIKLHRMPPRNNGTNKPAVLLMHGLLESSDCWLLQGPNKSLAYVLADDGFDVWMGNARGNKHSIEHKTLDYTSIDYWKFTWEEIGTYDLPAMIDYILQMTGKESLYYIGHSQGTTIGYVLLSMKPEYNDKIKIMFSFAPEAWMGNVKNVIIKLFSPAVNLLGSLLYDINTYSSGTEVLNKLSSFLCHWLPSSCDNIFYAMEGHNSKINQTLLPVIFGHMPTGSSALQFIHYGQLVNSKRFCRYDHGYDVNMELYGQSIPPDYNLSKVIVPNVIYYSGQDMLSDPYDVDILKSRLPFVLSNVYLSGYTHMAYTYAAEAYDDIYLRVIAIMNKFEDVRNNYVSKLELGYFIK